MTLKHAPVIRSRRSILLCSRPRAARVRIDVAHEGGTAIAADIDGNSSGSLRQPWQGSG
jgi:hypothetical protein